MSPPLTSLLPWDAPPLPALADVPHAIPYQGSKRALARAIVPLVPDDVDALVEPFAGSAAVSIAVRHLRLAGTARLGDVNGPLMDLWAAILGTPESLAARYEALWNDQLHDPGGYYVRVRDEFNAHPQPHLFLYLLARCVKAAVRYNRHGRFNQSPDQRRLGTRPVRMRQNILGTSRTMAGASLVVGDYEAVLLGAGQADLVYLDPPYHGVSSTDVRDRRYVRGVAREAFEAALTEAVTAGVSFVLSYDAVLDDRRYGAALPGSLDLLHLHVLAGRSSQATLQGTNRTTVESLYLSPALVDRLGGETGVRERLAARPERLPPPRDGAYSRRTGESATPSPRSSSVTDR